MWLVSRCVFGAALVLLSGCSGCHETGPAPSGEPSVVTPRGHKQLSRLGVGDGGVGFLAMRQRLEEQASNRPKAPLPPEAVLAAYEKAEVALDRKRQQLATPFMASFCMSAHAGNKVKLTVCEHESLERAEENVKALQKLERPERRIAKNGTTTLLVRRDLNDDSEAALVDKLVRIFDGLDATASDR